ncbi:MAG TPA: ferrous iron transport protein B [Candidatus Merdenecus merdavium]|nr:ferrous iron transport protein B [Candidatus Merdenecus merdavium]
MDLRIALAGNPNCGKTTLFNELTGSKQHVGNWPGVTVDKKEGTYKKDKDIVILDLPGIYSLSPYSAEEIVARDYIAKERPDALINIVDGTSIERNLYLTLQIMETQVPTVIAINMMDEVEARGDSIDCNKISKMLGVPVVPIVARSGKGIHELMKVAAEVGKKPQKSIMKEIYSSSILDGIEQVKTILDEPQSSDRDWRAIKIVEGDEILLQNLSKDKKEKVDQVISEIEKEIPDVESEIADQRYKYISKIVKAAVKKKHVGHVETKSDKLDKILTNKFLALPLFAVIMYFMFSITFGEKVLFVLPGPGVWLQDLVVNFWEGPLTSFIVNGITSLGASEWAISLVESGILAGLGGVVSFLPQILILFLLMSVLEDSGYMARVAFVMDRIFRKFGLSGRSFIPLLMGFGCSVPAMMATRTLESEKDRRLTLIITPFMSCGAKLPIYLMFAATLFPNSNQTWILFSIYFLGMATAVIVGIILNKTMFKGGESNFIMELPQYRIPTLKSVFIHGWEKVKGFAIKAGTIIFASTVLIWLLSSFSFTLEYLPEEEMNRSIIAQIGKVLQFIFVPLGFGNDWRPVVGTLTGFIAKENIVSTFAVLFNAAEGVADAAMEGAAALPGVADVFTKVSAYSYMAFNLLCMPCFAAVGALRKEMGSLKWTFKAIGIQMAVAYIVAFCINIIGNLLVMIF